jgi:hypothetical protein
MKEILIGKGEGGQVRVRYFHKVFVDHPNSKSYTSLVLLQNELLLQDKDYLEEDWRKKIEFSRAYLHRRLKQDGCLTCAYCSKTNLVIEDEGMSVPKNIIATLDHIVPLSKGGTNIETNLAIACYRCNTKKGSLDLVEFISRYKGQCKLTVTI